MASYQQSALGLGYICLLLSAWFSFTTALDFDFCAEVNTASMARNISIYQTNGLCHDFCLQTAAFAITQDKGCWCSDYFPEEASIVDSSKCNIPCPAFPEEKCGGRGLFGYLQLNLRIPSGTQSAPGATTTSAALITTVTASVTKTVQETVTSVPSETPTTSSSSSSPESTSSPPTTTGVRTVTDGGVIRTVTVVPTITKAPNDGDKDGVSMKKDSIGTGAIVGIVIGIIAAVLIIAGALIFWWLRRKRQEREAGYEEDPSIRGGSTSGMGSLRPEMSMTMSGGSPGSPSASVGNRNSALQIDPRMDPFKQGLYLRSGSHESINTLRDDHDYSRKIQERKVLRATNPDP